MSALEVSVIALAFVMAGIAKGAIGMGLPPIALGIMSLALPLGEALALMVVPTIATNVWQAVAGHGFWRLMRRFWTMALTATASTFWEFAEFVSDAVFGTRAQLGLEDTLLDTALGIAGGASYVLARWRQRSLGRVAPLPAGVL